MISVPSELPAAERARWLAELFETLDAAQRLLPRLALGAHQKSEALDLYVRIQAAQLEVRALRISRSLTPREHHGPERTELRPWQPAISTAPF